MKDLLKKYRRDLHRIPELGFEVYKTKTYIMEQLQQYPCEVSEVCKTGVYAFFQSREDDGKGQPREHTIAIRSDMDALPVSEESGASYCSTHEGAMHACGHDGHMAMLLGLAQELNQIIHTLPYNVLLIFQPAEETIGGAKDISNSGILEKFHVDRIYGIHLWPMIGKHVVASRAKELMSRSRELDVTIRGRSAHCANAEQGIDALSIGCEFVNELYQMVQTEIPKSEYRLLKFGKMVSGSVRNAISANTILEGTIRSFHENTGDFIIKRMEEIAADYEKKYRCSFSFNLSEGYPAVLNDPSLFKEAERLLSGFDFLTFEAPFMLSEDFSFYQQKIPGLLLFLGTGTNIPLHSNNFDFDEDVLYTGVQVYLKLLQEIKL